MNFLFPKFSLKQFWVMLGLACLGAGISGVYGMIHDQITYTISPEYFTKFKFHQFYYTDHGWPTRVRVLVIGFLATWWVGFIAGWFLARIAVPKMSTQGALQKVMTGFQWIVGSVVVFGIGAGVLGYFSLQGQGLQSWQNWQESLDLTDLRSFAIVGYIHDGGYGGALIGLIVAAILLKRKIR